MSPAVFDRTSFSGHETFPFRYSWLPKAVDAVWTDDQLFGREDALVKLGVGKNMVSSMRHWALACDLIREDPNQANNRGRFLIPTEFGMRLFGPDGWDQYFEDVATAWLIHWRLAATPEKATTWYWVFSFVRESEFKREELCAQLLEVAHQNRVTKVSPASLKRDVDCFFRTYVPARAGRTLPIEDTLDCPLVELGLIREIGGRGCYVLQRGDQPSLPDGVFAAAMVEFVGRIAGGAHTVPLDVVAFAPGSPGRVFCLDAAGLLGRLDRLEAITRGALRFDETAGLRQVLVKEVREPLNLLEDCYHARKAEVRMFK